MFQSEQRLTKRHMPAPSNIEWDLSLQSPSGLRSWNAYKIKGTSRSLESHISIMTNSYKTKFATLFSTRKYYLSKPGRTLNCSATFNNSFFFSTKSTLFIHSTRFCFGCGCAPIRLINPITRESGLQRAESAKVRILTRIHMKRY